MSSAFSPNAIADPLQPLVASLRLELQEYGEMLARLDQQQESILRRAAEDVLASASLVEDQGAVLKSVRQAREQVQRRLAASLNQPETISLLQLAPQLPPDYRPLITALAEENGALLQRVQQRARQNDFLLRRSLEMMQNLLQSLVPVPQGGAYDGSGRAAEFNLPSPVMCEALV